MTSQRIKLVTCTTPGCERYARHWLKCSKVRPQRREPICHRCYLKVLFTVPASVTTDSIYL